MWKQLIAPTLVVAGCWILVSPLTTYFIYWLDQSYAQSLTRNLASMKAAAEIREYVWRSFSEALTTSYQPESADLQPGLLEMTNRVEKALQQLRIVVTTAEDEALINHLETQWHEFMTLTTATDDRSSRGGSSQRFRQLREKAKSISIAADEVCQRNQNLWTLAEQHREHWKGIVLTARFVLVIAGLAVGIMLGWWISKHVNRSISQINIILKDASVEWDESLVKLQVSGSEGLNDLRERVESVILRMKHVSADLTAARREMLRAERLAAVGELAAGVAHELRNPMTSVKLLLQNAAHRPGDTTLTDHETCVVIDEVQRMENTIQGLLDFSRPPSPQRQKHDLRNTLQRALNLVQGRSKQQKVQIETYLPDSPLVIDGDPEQIHQVCVNLLLNGIEADSGGTLEIHAEEDRQANLIRVRFRDFGPGILEDVIVHLFEPFVSTKERGTGLGLAISRRIVIQHQGSLTAENHPVVGAVFTLELPEAAKNGVSATDTPSHHHSAIPARS